MHLVSAVLNFGFGFHQVWIFHQTSGSGLSGLKVIFGFSGFRVPDPALRHIVWLDSRKKDRAPKNADLFCEILVGSIGMYFTYEYSNAIKGQVTLSYIIHKTYLLTLLVFCGCTIVHPFYEHHCSSTIRVFTADFLLQMTIKQAIFRCFRQ